MNYAVKQLSMPRVFFAATILICCGAAAFAQDTLTLLNPPNTGFTEGGVYTSPYNINVNNGPNGTGTINTPLQLICDDFTTDITVGESWNATATTLTTLNSTTVAPLKFDNTSYNGEALGGAGDVVQDYAIAAVLASELLSLPDTDTQAAGDLSFALWDVFDSTLLGTSYASMSDPFGTITSTQWTDAMNDLTGAIAQVDGVITGGSANPNAISGLMSGGTVVLSSLNISSLTAYTPTPNAGVAQEFLQVTTPEASTPVVLAADLLGFFALVGFLRRRRAAKTV
jgi:hypothetical protein